MAARLPGYTGRLAPTQFGFREGMSTEDAFLALRDAVDNAGGKYVAGVLLDFRGATSTTSSTGRCSWNWRNTAARRTGCGPISCGRGRRPWSPDTGLLPAGSLSGPTLWNISMDPSLGEHEYEEHDEEAIAYADDLLVIARADARAERMVHRAGEWGDGAGVQLNPAKSEAVMLRGTLQRHPSYRHPISLATVAAIPAMLARALPEIGIKKKKRATRT